MKTSIMYKGKVWEDRRTISGLIGKSLEKVISWYKGFTIPERISIIARKTKINILGI